MSEEKVETVIKKVSSAYQKVQSNDLKLVFFQSYDVCLKHPNRLKEYLFEYSFCTCMASLFFVYLGLLELSN